MTPRATSFLKARGGGESHFIVQPVIGKGSLKCKCKTCTKSRFRKENVSIQGHYKSTALVITVEGV